MCGKVCIEKGDVLKKKELYKRFVELYPSGLKKLLAQRTQNIGVHSVNNKSEYGEPHRHCGSEMSTDTEKIKLIGPYETQRFPMVLRHTAQSVVVLERSSCECISLLWIPTNLKRETFFCPVVFKQEIGSSRENKSKKLRRGRLFFTWKF